MITHRLTTVALGVGVFLAVQRIAPESFAAAPDQQGPVFQMETSTSSRIAVAIKSSVGKVAHALNPSPPKQEASDPISLATKATPSPQLYLSIAEVSEKGGRFDEARRHYEQALKLDPKRLDTLLRYARFEDRRDNLSEATEIYQRAARLHASDPSVFNDMGLCFARRNMLSQSLSSLKRAIQLRPDQRLYRNNIATVLVEMGDLDAAFSQLKAVHSEAVAYYNLGYLLQKKGDPRAAAVLFGEALEKNPALAEAKIWLDRLGPQGPPATANPRGPQLQAALPRRNAAGGLPSPAVTRSGAMTINTAGGSPLPPEQLPPSRPATAVESAPMPPQMSFPTATRSNPLGSTVQPLPPVSEKSFRR